MKVLLLLFLCGCSVTASQSEDGKILKISGYGSATFDNGASIESKPPVNFENINYEGAEVYKY